MENKADTSSRFPLLEKIDSPDDLRRLDPTVLPEVCAELRRMIIDNLAVNPGHFASSMGAVELTVALHYVFDTPRDRIVWDVGHQAYGHKILTGRRDLFATNRKLNGISGFPNPDESPYDTFTAGHASNSISAALGMAVASKLNADEPPRNVVAVIGDASIAGGLAFEGLNNAANSRSNLLIILNDNDMSIDRNTGSLNSYLAHITASPSYNALRYNIYRFLRRLGVVGDRGRGLIMRFNNSLKSLISKEQNIFEGLNIRYFGPFDGHDLPRLIRVLTDIKDMQGPRILHLRTVKGRGFPAAENDPAGWHAPGLFDPATGRKITPDPAKKLPPRYQDVMADALIDLAADDKRIVAVTAAMPSGTSVSRFQREFPDRTFDVGISEGHAVTFSGGMARDGLRPFCAIYSSFLQRAYDHIIHDVAIQRLPVTFLIDRAGLVGEDGVTHHGLFDIAALRPVPGMIIASPRDEDQLRHLMLTAARRDEAPMAIRYPRGRATRVGEPAPMKQLEIGRGECLRTGSDVAVLTLGPVAADALEAARRAADKGVSAAVYDMIFAKPLDAEILTDIGRRGIPVVTVEDASVEGGMGSAILEWFADNGFSNHVVRLGVGDEFVAHGSVDELHRLCGFDTDSIYSAILSTASKS